jgi:hypothetical protein
MSRELKFEGQNLPPIDDLLSIGNVSESDVIRAVESWRKNPPEEGFELILEAEIEN